MCRYRNSFQSHNPFFARKDRTILSHCPLHCCSLPVQTKETAYALNDLFAATCMFSYVNPQSQIHTKMAKEMCVCWMPIPLSFFFFFVPPCHQGARVLQARQHGSPGHDYEQKCWLHFHVPFLSIARRSHQQCFSSASVMDMMATCPMFPGDRGDGTDNLHM